ncbi:MAG: helix-turn-helix transcriptional regulator [Nocardioidaceae bacterium]
MSQGLTTTSYALLGLLRFDDATDSSGLTGYELKQRADNTLRFYWVSPAMSQVYSELSRLTRQSYVEAVADTGGGRTTHRYRITQAGRDALQAWLATQQPEFPILKHPVALRLLMGRLGGDKAMASMLQGYIDALAQRRTELDAVRDRLGQREAVRYAAMVADWGLAYYDAERDIVTELLGRLSSDAR